MRDILFRGKRVDNGKWVEGYVFEREPPLQCFAGDKQEESEWYICKTAFADWNMPRNVEFIKVVAATLGQWTGLTDKNGVKVFEGDVIKYQTEEGRYKCKNIYQVVFEQRGGSSYFGIAMDDIETWQFCMSVPAKLMLVVGTIYDKETDHD